MNGRRNHVPHPRELHAVSILSTVNNSADITGASEFQFNNSNDMEGKISGVKARGRPRRAWTDDLKDWTELKNYSELKRTAEDRTIWNALARRPST